MVASVSHTTVDCSNAFELSQWWKRALGYVDVAGDPNEPGDEECMILDPDTGHRLLFVEVPDPVWDRKNSIHLDLTSRDGDRDSELEVLLELGASVVADRRGIHGPGSGWVTLSDPEGNVFCIVRS